LPIHFVALIGLFQAFGIVYRLLPVSPVNAVKIPKHDQEENQRHQQQWYHGSGKRGTYRTSYTSVGHGNVTLGANETQWARVTVAALDIRGGVGQIHASANGHVGRLINMATSLCGKFVSLYATVTFAAGRKCFAGQAGSPVAWFGREFGQHHPVFGRAIGT